MNVRALVEPRVWLPASVVFHLACALVLVPVASHPYDLAVLSGNAQAWLNWGFSPFYNWKFGLDYAVLALLAQTLRAFLAAIGLPGVVSLHIAWKLPLVAADLLTARAIYRLGLKLAPDRAALLAALWLVNPVVLWVSAGHGQIESAAILCMFASLQLCIDGRLFLAGVVTGLGVGLEYFPIASAGSVILWWRAGQLQGRRPLVSFASGLGVSLAFCFVPQLLDSIGRASIIDGLAFSGGVAQPGTESLLSIWTWVDYRWAHYWPIVFGASGIVCLAVVWRFAKRGPEGGILFLSIALVLAVLLDANALAQFAVIAAASLWLLALVIPVQPVNLIAVPVAGLATVFLFLDGGAASPNAFFFDDWATTGAQLWPVPRSAQGAVFLGHLFSIGLVATVTYALVRRTKAHWVFWPAASTMAAGTCAVLVVWALQPAIWQSAFSIVPAADVPDFDQFVTTRPGQIVDVGANTFQVSYSDTLIRAARQSSVLPTAGVSVSMQDLFNRVSATKALPPESWPDRSITIPEWSEFRPAIQTLWVEVLVGSTDWAPTSPPKTTDLSLLVGTAGFTPARVELVASSLGEAGWAIADFNVPSASVDAAGRIDLLPQGPSLKWNGSNDGPWVRIVPASGTLQTVVDSRPIGAPFQLNSFGHGYVLGFPLRGSYLVNLGPRATPGYVVSGAVLRWTDAADTWKLNPWLQLLGSLYCLLLISATGYVMRIWNKELVSRRTESQALDT